MIISSCLRDLGVIPIGIYFKWLLLELGWSAFLRVVDCLYLVVGVDVNEL